MGDNLQISKLKFKNLQKWAQFLMFEIKRIMGYICRWYAFLCKNLLAHAEAGEDGAEDFVGRDFAGDFAKVMHAFTYVLAEQITANS